MISALNRQGGRRYPQFGSTPALVGYLPLVGSGGATPVAPPAPEASGGAGGGSTQNQPNRRPDFDRSGRRIERASPQQKAIAVVAKQAADEVIEKARELARERAQLKVLQDAKAKQKNAEAKAKRVAAMEAKVAKMEADLAILQDDEEVLMILKQIL